MSKKTSVIVVLAGIVIENRPFSSLVKLSVGCSLIPMVAFSMGSPSVPLTVPLTVAVCADAKKPRKQKMRRICCLKELRKTIR